jgi:hypothetical protein
MAILLTPAARFIAREDSAKTEKDGNTMNGWKVAYVNAVDSLLAKGVTKVSNEILQTKIESMNPAYRSNSQGIADFVGIRGLDGSIVRPNGRKGVVSDWRKGYPVLFLANGAEYELLPVNMRLQAITGNSAPPATPKTKAELLAELAALEAATPVPAATVPPATVPPAEGSKDAKTPRK